MSRRNSLMSGETQTQYLKFKDTVNCPKDTIRKVNGKCQEGYVEDSEYKDCCEEYIQSAQPRTEEPYNYRRPKGQGLMTKFYPRNTNYNKAQKTEGTLKRKRQTNINSIEYKKRVIEENLVKEQNYQEGLAFIEEQQQGLYEAKRINKEEEIRLKEQIAKQEILDKKIEAERQRLEAENKQIEAERRRLEAEEQSLEDERQRLEDERQRLEAEIQQQRIVFDSSDILNLLSGSFPEESNTEGGSLYKKTKSNKTKTHKTKSNKTKTHKTKTNKTKSNKTKTHKTKSNKTK